MTRFERRNRTDIEFKGCGGITDLFDDAIKEAWRINDEEYDYLCEFTDDINCPLYIDKGMSISELKAKIKEVNELLEEYHTNGLTQIRDKKK